MKKIKEFAFIIVPLLSLVSCSDKVQLGTNFATASDIKEEYWLKEVVHNTDIDSLYASKKNQFDYTGFSFSSIQGYTTDYYWVLDDASHLESSEYAMVNTLLCEFSTEGSVKYAFAFPNLYGKEFTSKTMADISKMEITSSGVVEPDPILEGEERSYMIILIDGIEVGRQTRKFASNHYVVADNDITDRESILTQFKASFSMADFTIGF